MRVMVKMKFSVIKVSFERVFEDATEAAEFIGIAVNWLKEIGVEKPDVEIRPIEVWTEKERDTARETIEIMEEWKVIK